MLGLIPGHPLAWLPIGIYGLISWTVWLIRRTMSHRALPIDFDFTCTASVVIPVYREDAAVLLPCLDTWIAAGPDEVILVVDTGDIECLEALAARHLPDFVQVIEFAHRGKRSALGVGIRAARGEIVVLADSDTAWMPDLLSEVKRPFADPLAGAVGTRQTVAAVETSVWRRLASWLVDIRFLDYVPAMGAAGCVPCVSGRTAAYRRSVIVPLLPQLEHEVFLGRECVAGDDGRLTWLVLGAGYETVHQRSAHAISMFPDTFSAFTKQRIRWSRNSYRCYLTAAWKGWLWRQPLISQITVMQMLLTPVTMGIALVALAFAAGRSSLAVGALLVAWLFVGRAIRGLSHLRERPRDIWLLPLVVVMVAFIALPVKLWSFITMNRQGWLTRSTERVGGEGQTALSLAGHGLID